MVLDYFQQQKKLIYPQIVALLKQCQQDLDLTPFSREAINKIEKSCAEGKFIRSGLLLKAVTMFGGKINQTVLRLAAALEILHNSLLIHDDIMDNDYLRRGQPSIFAQYLPLAQAKTKLQQDLWARAVGIGVGDLGFFVGLWLAGQNKNIYDLLCRELIRVCDGQLNDLAADTKATVKQVERIYLDKTAYYTFYLPLQLGAILTKQSVTISRKLEQLSQKMGLLFQLHNDELSLVSDVRENKQTLLKLWLSQGADITEKKTELRRGAEKIIKQLKLNKEEQKFWSEFCSYLFARFNRSKVAIATPKITKALPTTNPKYIVSPRKR